MTKRCKGDLPRGDFLGHLGISTYPPGVGEVAFQAHERPLLCTRYGVQSSTTRLLVVVSTASN